MVAVASVAVLTGCPVPLVPRYESESRHNIGEQLPGFIVDGTTTRADVLLHLGEPDGRGPEDRWFAYGSRYNEGGVLFVAIGAGGGGAAVGARSIRYRRIVVRFDEQGVVASAGFVERSCPSVIGMIGSTYSSTGGESAPCIDVAIDDAPVSDAKAASGSGAGGRRTTKGKFATATVNIAPADVVEWRAEPTDVRVEVTDRRTNIVMERVAAGTIPMSDVVLQPGETDLIASIVTAKLREAIAAQPGLASPPPVACELTEFSITTPGTILYWDVTADIAITLRVGNQQRSLTAHAVERTYWWPTESLIKDVTVEALKVIATGSGPLLSELITSAPGTSAVAPGPAPAPWFDGPALWRPELPSRPRGAKPPPAGIPGRLVVSADGVVFFERLGSGGSEAPYRVAREAIVRAECALPSFAILRTNGIREHFIVLSAAGEGYDHAMTERVCRLVGNSLMPASQ